MRWKVHALRAAWIAVATVVAVGAGAVVGDLLLPVLGRGALLVQAGVSIGLVAAAGVVLDDAVDWMRGHLERGSR